MRDDKVKLIVEIPKKAYDATLELGRPSILILQDNVIYDMLANGIPLDNLTTQIERLKYQHTDVSGYRWWNNAIDNCLHEIRDV